ncbi:putative S-layer protein [Candidatus Pacearchaeota archaeon]|nr:putative S-layer protein [Candidatus Pacearchaeota archaeon]
MNYKNLCFVLAAMVLFSMALSLASAANELVFNQSSASLTLNHGTTANALSFFLNNTLANQNITNISFSATSLTTGTYTISSGNITLPANVSLIQYNSTSSLLTAYIAVPQYQQPGTYAGTITASGTNGTSLTAQLSISLTVNSTSALSLSAPAEVNKAQNISSFTITNTGNVDLTNINISYGASSIKDSAGRQATLSFSPNNFDLAKSASRAINITSVVPSNMHVNDYSTVITANSSSGTSATAALKVISDYCRYGKNGTDAEILSIKDTSSDNDWEWKPLDKVDVEVNVRNNGDDDEDITVEIGLYDPQDNEFLDLDDNEKTVLIADGKSKALEFTIEVPTDIKDIDYRLYARAFYDDDEKNQCSDRFDSSFYKLASIEKESRDVTIQNINAPSSVSCGETVEITAKAYNIGKRDEDKVYVNLLNKELGINQNSDSFVLDELESKSLSFSIIVPKNATQKDYTLNLKSYYDYDEYDDNYDASSTFTTLLKVSGSCITSSENDVSISASLADGSENIISGGKMKLKVALTNPKDAETTYTLSASDYQDWASLEKVEPSSLTLKKGESKDAYLYFDIKGDASGEKIFKVKIGYDSQFKEQSLAVTIKKSTLTGMVSAFASNIKNNWVMLVLVLVNVVLIAGIILVAVKLSKPRVNVLE